jgi:hypothetical protein
MTVARSSSHQSIYDGRELIGVIRRVGKKFEARDATRRLIGRYRTAKQAAAAINQSCEEAREGESPAVESRSRG